MKTVEQLLKRQAELEGAMKQRGGARVTEDLELQEVKRKLGAITSGILDVPLARCSLTDFVATAGSTSGPRNCQFS